MVSFRRWINSLLKSKADTVENMPPSKRLEYQLSKNINENIQAIQVRLHHSFDIRSRYLTLGNGQRIGLVYCEALIKEETLQEHVIKALLTKYSREPGEPAASIKDIASFIVSSKKVQETTTLEDAVSSILLGNTFLCMQGSSTGLILTTMGFENRSIDEPTNEPSVKGPREGLIENIKINIGLIRKRLRDPNLVVSEIIIGKRSKSTVLVLSIHDIVQPELLEEVTRRLKEVQTDITIEANQISHFINDNPNCIFPLVQISERPDKLISALTEGRIAILVEGSPTAIIVPVTFPMLLQTVDDYYENWLVSSVIRIMRYLSLYVSVLFPAIYIAITSFHPGVLPTELAFSIAATRGGIPLPAFFEAILMVFTLELLQEAGIRLPRVIGQTVSIVGGLVIGQAAVQAGLVSPIMVIVIATTAIASFTIPDYSLSLASRILRVPFMFLGATLGMFGISMGALYLLGYIADQKSFGLPYLTAITPYRTQDFKDTLVRMPQRTFKKRPNFLRPQNIKRQDLSTHTPAYRIKKRARRNTMQNTKLENHQMATIAIPVILGINILMVQHPITIIAKNDAWISMLLGGIITIGIGFLYYYLSILNRGLDFPQICLAVGGNIFGRILLLPALIYVLLDSGFILRVFANSLKVFLLDRTPLSVIMTLLVIVIISVVKRGIYTLGAVVEILFPIVMLTLVVLIFMAKPQLDTRHIQPILYKNTGNTLKAVLPAFNAFISYGVVLYIIPHAKEPEKTLKWVILSSVVSTFLYTILTLFVILSFSADEVVTLSYPIIVLAKSIEFDVTFLERLESYFIIMWTLTVFINGSLYAYGSIRNVSTFFSIPQRYYRLVAYSLIPFILIIGLLSESNLESFSRMYQMLRYSTVLPLGVVPLLVLLSRMKGRRLRMK